jgi:hypothetical protein
LGFLQSLPNHYESRSDKRKTKDRLNGATSSRSGERRKRVKSQEGRVADGHAVLTVLTQYYFASKFLAIPVIIADERIKKDIYNDNNNIRIIGDVSDHLFNPRHWFPCPEAANVLISPA